MLNEKGLPRPELFLEDRLHMNAEGYRIWQKNIQPYLAK
jgi:lysophospholipase L1-like esterase